MKKLTRTDDNRSDLKGKNSACQLQNTKYPPQISSPADRVMPLQRALGNQAVQGLFESAGIRTEQPGDICEQEADRVTDRLIRPPDNFNVPIHVTNAPVIQKDEDEDKVTPDPENEKVTNPNLSVQLPEPDFLKLRSPFIERNAYSLWDPASALSVWKYNFDFFKRLGLKDDLAGKASNLTAPFAIDAQLKADKPKWWEITDNELRTTSFTLSIPLFDFGADFRNWKPLPFL